MGPLPHGGGGGLPRLQVRRSQSRLSGASRRETDETDEADESTGQRAVRLLNYHARGVSRALPTRVLLLGCMLLLCCMRGGSLVHATGDAGTNTRHAHVMRARRETTRTCA